MHIQTLLLGLYGESHTCSCTDDILTLSIDADVKTRLETEVIKAGGSRVRVWSHHVLLQRVKTVTGATFSAAAQHYSY